MTERKKIHKIFFAWEFEKEERWLNEMSMEGWALEKASFGTYRFTRCEPGEYIIRMELNSAPDYRRFVEEAGGEYIGSCVNWVYFRRRADLGEFKLQSDLDSRIAHFDRIGRTLGLIGSANLLIGMVNTLNGLSFAWINLLCATLLMYGLGRIHGKKDALKDERILHE